MSNYRVPFVDFAKEDEMFEEGITQAINKCRKEGKYILQEDVEEFEVALAEFVGTKYAIGVNSGTDALFLSLKMLGVGEGDEVITVGHTFHATVEVIKHCGALPILVDVGEDAMMDVTKVVQAITPRTKAIIPVHLMGDMVDMPLLMKIAGHIPVVEDACQALGADTDGKKAGAWGKTGCFSFYPAKILGCMGDGGAITTDDEELADELKDLRNHYKFNPGKYGYNSRLDNVHAAVLNVKIKRLPEILARRQEIADIYDRELQGVTLPTQREGRVYQDYIIRSDQRDNLASFLKENGIDTLKNDYHFPDDLPKPVGTMKLERETLRLPCNETLTDEDVYYIVDKINEFFEE